MVVLLNDQILYDDVLNRLHHSHTGCIVSVAEPSQKSTLKPTDGSNRMVLQQTTEMKKSSCPVPERSVCKTIHVQPTGTILLWFLSVSLLH